MESLIISFISFVGICMIGVVIYGGITTNGKCFDIYKKFK